MTSKSKQYCSVPQCNNYISKNVSMHKFPSDKIIQEQWKRALNIGKPVTKYMRVCSGHFVFEDFSKNNPNPLKRHLKKGVIPSGRISSTSNRNIGNARSSRKSLAVDKSMEVGPVPDHMVHPGHLNEHLPIPSVPMFARTLSTSYGKQKQPLMPVHLVDEFNEGIKTFADKGVQTEVQDFQLLDVLDTDKKLMCFTGIDHSILKKIETCGYNVAIYNSVEVTFLRIKLLLVLVKLRLNIPFACLAILFSLSPTTCMRYFYGTLELLATALKPIIYWPTKDDIRANLPVCFDKFKTTRVILDCTEVPVQKCACLKCRIKTYSHYKGTHTIKWLIGITPSGLISYIGPAYGGRSSDKSIFVKENFISKCDTYDSIMVDKGFMIESECEEMFIKLIRPPFLKNNKQLSQQDAEITADIARARVHVERAIQRIKTYRIVSDKIEWYLVPHVDEIMLIVGALVNLSSPILADDKFCEM